MDCKNNHQAITGDTLRIYGTTHYNGKYTITVLDSDSFKITATWVSDDAKGIATDDIMWYNPTGTPENPRTVYSNWFWAVDGNGHSYITLYNLTCYCGGDSWGVIQFERIGDPLTSSYFTVDHCTVKYAGSDGIRNALPGHHYTITNNTITDFTVGIYINRYAAASDYVTISNNYFDCGTAGLESYWCPTRGPQSYDRGAIILQPGDYYTISENYIARCVECGIFAHRFMSSGETMKSFHVLRNWIDGVYADDGSGASFGIGTGGGNGEDSGDRMPDQVIAYNIVKNCKRPGNEDPTGFYGIGLRLSCSGGLAMRCESHLNPHISPCNGPP